MIDCGRGGVFDALRWLLRLFEGVVRRSSRSRLKLSIDAAGIGYADPVNYLAHAAPLLTTDPDPYLVAGVAVPDWLGVAARRTKCRSKHAAPFLGDMDPRVASLARGIMQHHWDDAWFHECPAFAVLSLEFARRIREAFADSSGVRPWFLGHVLVELLLDAELDRRTPGLLDGYYRVVERVDPELVAASVASMAGRPVGRLAEFIPRFVEVRFLADYADDDRLAFRLGQVCERVGLPPLPPQLATLLPAMRNDVAQRTDELVTAPGANL
ncbi:hypothetical protein Pla175_41100 [Pirellulimonas nuda]|uniref:Uncharacterized protein n=2 Tax=Pirellulimonas nuda TaxID=2528009 RepID=A0A518DGU5_9BACT|nr:hypothetical protein Pla175_41100 [Pirellulimonas nuda]